MTGTHPACADDPELFFPISYGRAADKQIAAAKAVCGPCPVRAACLQAALDNEHRDGIWGGTTPDERKDLYPVRQVVLDRPELDKKVATMTGKGVRPEQMAETLGVSVAVIRRCSKRNRQNQLARKSVSA
jgi:WhiB family redox-sensing transcriptional regulator